MIVRIITTTGNKYTFWGVSRWSLLLALFSKCPVVLSGQVEDGKEAVNG